MWVLSEFVCFIVHLILQVQQQPTQVSMWDSIQTVPCTNQLASETAAAHSISSPDDDKDTTGLRRSRSTSDITMDVESKLLQQNYSGLFILAT